MLRDYSRIITEANLHLLEWMRFTKTKEHYNRIYNRNSSQQMTSKWPANDQQIGPVSQATDNQAVFNDGAYFSEVVGKKKDLFKALDISLPEDEMGVSYEEDDKVGVDDEDYTNVEDLPV